MENYITNLELNKLKSFFEKGRFIVCSEKLSKPIKYFWEKDYFDKNFNKSTFNELYIYSLIENNKNAYILEGYDKKHALGYFISRNKINIPDYKIKYW